MRSIRYSVFNTKLGLYAYVVSRTSFVLIFDFDDIELRMHMIVHKSADRDLLDPTTVEW